MTDHEDRDQQNDGETGVPGLDNAVPAEGGGGDGTCFVVCQHPMTIGRAHGRPCRMGQRGKK